ncbi:DUF2019 domain-containing protein [Undibacterium sp. TS12]|uniref:DUF2019 domain-containing protein n=1 Tax=Undibacterium sp. TS12 TaxID=2908202 RepID=UPI001F4CA9C8|nr:DUF2019 domain-containing protein [Undibacterium sp. TS12]MCH8622562.1 DUF2019 domain-containing protein [Undibacterium sp. TS12]
MANVTSAEQMEFINNAEEYWQGSAKHGNAKERANKKIVAKWAESAMVADYLLPLLEHNSAKVRLAAAAHLLNYSEKEKAIEVLRDLVDHPSLIGSSADAVLRIHKISVTP